MGSIHKSSEINKKVLLNVGMPVILLTTDPHLIPDNCEKISLNILLAERLVSVPPEQHPQKITDEIRSILYRDTAPVLLEKYEMLFSLVFQLNILKIFADIARVRPLYIPWAGHCKNGCLVYPEPDDPEYRPPKSCRSRLMFTLSKR